MTDTSQSRYYRDWYRKNRKKKLSQNRKWNEKNKEYLRNLYLKRYKKKLPNLKERLLSSYIKVGDCWEWNKCRSKSGYGRVIMRSLGEGYAHRASYKVFVGDIPNDMFVCHSCDNPSCINPAHLWLGDAKANAQDRERKGRGRFPQKETC